MGSLSVTKESHVDRHVSGVSLHGGLERPSCEAVKLEPALPWRPQDVRDGRAAEWLPRETTNKTWSQPERRKCVAVNKYKRKWRSEAF